MAESDADLVTRLLTKCEQLMRQLDTCHRYMNELREARWHDVYARVLAKIATSYPYSIKTDVLTARAYADASYPREKLDG
jgi:hypothetical protein